MLTVDFNTLLDDCLYRVKKVLGSKAAEYATEDRLHNFKVAAALTYETPKQACWGMAVKHLVSIADAVNYGYDWTYETWDEKLIDAMGYLALLRGLVRENETRA